MKKKCAKVSMFPLEQGKKAKTRNAKKGGHFERARRILAGVLEDGALGNGVPELVDARHRRKVALQGARLDGAGALVASGEHAVRVEVDAGLGEGEDLLVGGGRDVAELGRVGARAVLRLEGVGHDALRARTVQLVVARDFGAADDVCASEKVWEMREEMESGQRKVIVNFY